MHVPTWMRTPLDAAVSAGRDEAAGWARVHPTGSTNRFHGDVLKRIAPPPTGDAAAADLQLVRDAAATRTSSGDARAVDLARRAGWDVWEGVIADIRVQQGPEQAHRAQVLLRAATDRTHAITSTAKEAWGRPRPYEVDSSIKTVVTRPEGNPGYPSGHAAGAYAPALLLSALLPARAAEFMDLAAEVAWSRVYGGVHFPSDVVAGARIAGAVVADVLRRDAAGLEQRSRRAA
jgi:acid phosphatase (class A)